MKKNVFLIASLMGCLAFAQSLSYRTEVFSVAPEGANYTAQVGVFVNNTSGADIDALAINAIIDYNVPGPATLTGAPIYEGFDGTTVPPTVTGLTDPASATTGEPNASLHNSVTASMGADIPFLAQGPGALAVDGSGVAGNATSGTVSFTLAGTGQPILSVANNTEELFLIIAFSVTGDMSVGTIELDFDQSAPTNNALIGDDGITLIPAGIAPQAPMNDGLVTLFAPVDCMGGDLTGEDLNIAGAPTAGSLALSWTQPGVMGGNGGELQLNISDPMGIDRIGIDYPGGTVNVTPAGGTTVTFLTDGSGSSGVMSPLASDASSMYTVFYEVEFPPMSGTFVRGAGCSFTATWAAASATIVSVPSPVTFGAAFDIDVTCTNCEDQGGFFGVLSSTAVNLPGTVNAVAPTSVAQNVLTFDNIYQQVGAAGNDDTGGYTFDQWAEPQGTPGSVDLSIFFQCPTNNTNCGAFPLVDIGDDPVTLPIAADFAADIDVTYNGVTTNYPGGTTMADIGPIVGDVQDVTVTANGFDNMGQPCDDEVICDLDFNPPTCMNPTQNPDSTVTAVDPGTMIALGLSTTNAVDVELFIGGMSIGNMTPMTDPLVNYAVDWTFNYTASAPLTIDATVTNPDGETTTCSWVIDVNCAAIITGVSGTPSNLLVEIEGVGDVVGIDYNIWAAPCGGAIDDPVPAGAVNLGVITLVDPVGGGFVAGNGVFTNVPPDSCIYVTCASDLTDTTLDVFVIRVVPTLGQWGLVIFATLLMAAGVFFMRRKRIA